MPVQIPPDVARRALQALEVTDQKIETIRRVPFEQAQVLLAELKANARRVYKRLAIQLHPDQTGGDQDKTDLFVLLGQVLAELEKTTVAPPRPQPQAISFRVNVQRPQAVTWIRVNWSGQDTATTTCASSSSTGFTAAQVSRLTTMRPK